MAWRSPPDPLAELRGLLLRGGGWEGRGGVMGGKRRGGEGKIAPPFLKFVDLPLYHNVKESGKVILDPQFHFHIRNRININIKLLLEAYFLPSAHGYQVWSTIH